MINEFAMTNLYYAWDRETDEVKPCSYAEWAQFFYNKENRRVANNKIGSIEVSSVFIGLGHVKFEVLVFHDGVSKDCWRFLTSKEAMELHNHLVRLIKTDSFAAIRTMKWK